MAACNSEAVAPTMYKDRNQWFCSKKPFGLLWLKGWKPPLFPQRRIMRFLVILYIILGCSGRILNNLVWKPQERSLKPRRFGVPPVGEIQNETQQVELKERWHEVTWLNYEQVTFCCDSGNLFIGIVTCPNRAKAWSCRMWFVLWLDGVFEHVTWKTWVHFRLQATNLGFVTSSTLLRRA